MRQESIITRFRASIGERKDIENAIAESEAFQALKDFNIAMGILEDPKEDEDE